MHPDELLEARERRNHYIREWAAACRRANEYRDAWVAEIKQREIAEAKLRQIRKLAKAAA